MLLMEPATRALLTASVAAVSPAVPLVGGIFIDDSLAGWSVTPSDAYTWGYQPPQGCSCQATGVSLIDCEASSKTEKVVVVVIAELGSIRCA